MTAELIWGLKTSLLGYVEALPDGSITVSGGATRAVGGEIRFPFAERSSPAGRPEVRFTGSVILSGHSGVMRIGIRDPWIELAPDGAVLTVIDEALDDGLSRITVARVTVVTDGDSSWHCTPVRLTADGALILGALQYYEGMAVDDVRFSVPSGTPAQIR